MNRRCRSHPPGRRRPDVGLLSVVAELRQQPGHLEPHIGGARLQRRPEHVAVIATREVSKCLHNRQQRQRTRQRQTSPDKHDPVAVATTDLGDEAGLADAGVAEHQDRRNPAGHRSIERRQLPVATNEIRTSSRHGVGVPKADPPVNAIRPTAPDSGQLQVEPDGCWTVGSSSKTRLMPYERA